MGNGFNLSLKKAIRDGLIVGKWRTEVNGRLISVSAAGAAVGFGSLPLDDFPAGKRLNIHGIRANLGFTRMDTNVVATWNGDWSLGSAPTADVTLAGAEVDLIPSTAIGPAVAGVIPGVDVQNNTPILNRAWTAAEEINLNLLVDAADITDGATAVIRVSGYIDFLLGMY
jgi:hypothetical protein